MTGKGKKLGKVRGTQIEIKDANRAASEICITRLPETTPEISAGNRAVLPFGYLVTGQACTR